MMGCALDDEAVAISKLVNGDIGFCPRADLGLIGHLVEAGMQPRTFLRNEDLTPKVGNYGYSAGIWGTLGRFQRACGYCF